METTPHGWRIFDAATPVLVYEYRVGITRSNALAVGGRDGLVIVSPPPPGTDEGMFEDLRAFGPVRALVASNAFHHLGIAEWKKRFPDAEVFAPAQSVARVQRKTGLAVRALAYAADVVGPNLDLVELPFYRTGEALVRIRTPSGLAWYVTDIILNIQVMPKNLLLNILFRLTGAPGLGYHRVGPRFMVRDMDALKRWFRREYELDPPRWLIATHGAIADFSADPEAAESLFEIRFDLCRVIAEEIEHIRPGSAFAGDSPPTPPQEPDKPGKPRLEDVQLENFMRGASALCLSGGGIRSAAFSLGAVEGLAKRGYLHKFDYMFTVSGGGYTGSLLATWIYRCYGGVREVVDRIRAPMSEGGDPICWLRKYTKYLSPRLGAISLDTWTLFATYLRNLLLNWLILLPLLGLIVAIPFVYYGGMVHLAAWLPRALPGGLDEDTVGRIALGIGLVLTAIACYCLRWRTSIIEEDVRTESRIGFDSFIVTGIALGAAFIALGWYCVVESGTAIDFVRILFAAVALQVLAFALFVVTKGFENWKKGGWAHVAAGFILSGLAFGVLLALWTRLFSPGLVEAYPRVFFSWGPPVFILCVVAAEILFAGVSSKVSGDFHREWWSRVDAELLRASFVWGTLSTMVLLLPDWVGNLDLTRLPADWTIALIALFGGGLARVAFLRGMYGKRDEVAHTPGATRYVEPLISAFSGIFVVMLFAWLAARFEETACIVAGQDASLPCPTLDILAVLGIAVGLAVVLVFFSSTVNINRFSLHAMYRERLIRAFLGGSRTVHAISVVPDTDRERLQFSERRENPYTDFDVADNPVMAWLRPGREIPGIPATDAKRPFLVIACALNLVAARNLAWQERKAASFTISPLHSGSSRLEDTVGYCRTRDVSKDVGGITLGTAFTISGAAVSPNAGYHSRPLITFIMTLFNARLGWWLGKPNNERVRGKDSPSNAFKPMFKELFGRTDDSDDWVHLSDGGHFDNLGLYEAVNRGCKYIVVIDGSADPERKFDDLGNAIRKIRVDLGIPVERQGQWLIGNRDRGQAGRYCAVFAVRYEARLGTMEAGWLVYIKSAIYPDPTSMVPTDILNYALQAPQFPHEPTGEQFFGEAQFESYRALGEHEIATLLDPFDGAHDFDDFVTAAIEHATFDDSRAARAP